MIIAIHFTFSRAFNSISFHIYTILNRHFTFVNQQYRHTHSFNTRWKRFFLNEVEIATSCILISILIHKFTILLLHVINLHTLISFLVSKKIYEQFKWCVRMCAMTVFNRFSIKLIAKKDKLISGKATIFYVLSFHARTHVLDVTKFIQKTNSTNVSILIHTPSNR